MSAALLVHISTQVEESREHDTRELVSYSSSEQEEEEERLLLHNNNNITVQKCDNTKGGWRSTEEGQGRVWPGLNCFWTCQKAEGRRKYRLGGNSWFLLLVSC